MSNHVGLPLCFVLLALFAGTRDVQAVTASAESNVTAVDTRTLTMTQLTVTGPSSLPSGSQEPYTATLSYQGAPPEDVTAKCQWDVTGGPSGLNWWEGAVMQGNILNPRVDSPIPVSVTARIERDNAAIVSAPLAVTITPPNDLNMGIQFLSPTSSGPVYVRTALSEFVWQMRAEASGLAVSQPGVTFQWFLDGQSIATGKTRDGELTVDVPVEPLAGEQGDLVFRLVSRGQPNAVVTIHDLVAVTVEDADNDGLSNAAEAALGTSAMSADTDGEGVSDAAEVNIHLTSPLRVDTDGDGPSDGVELAAGTDPKNPLSRLAITATAFAPAGFSLQWSSQPVRNYRVLRSPTPGFESYNVLGAVLSNASPTQSFLDSSLTPGAVPAMFYRVELAP